MKWSGAIRAPLEKTKMARTGTTVRIILVNGEVYNSYYVPRNNDPAKQIAKAERDLIELAKKFGAENVEMR